MQYEIQYAPKTADTAEAHFKIICKDHEAKAFLKAINETIKKIEAARKREFKEGIKEGARMTPLKPMKMNGTTYIFEDYCAEDVTMAARHITGRMINVAFSHPQIEVTQELVDDFVNKLSVEK